MKHAFHPQKTGAPVKEVDRTVFIRRSRAALIALAGQPNMGKSTLFNLLTGLNQHVGNWPGKTVERREGHFQIEGRDALLVDLPGTYSLTANSPEEVIAREYILLERPDVVIAVVSAANLERSLYLTAELLALEAPLVVALNMMDVAQQEGIEVDPSVLETALGVPVVPITATKAKGVRELLEVVQAVLNGQRVLEPHPPAIRADHAQALEQITRLISGRVPDPYPTEWVALKLLEGDAVVTRHMQEILAGLDPLTGGEHLADNAGSDPLAGKADTPDHLTWRRVEQVLRQHDDAMLAVASGRYEWIGRIVQSAVARPRMGQIGLTERLDRWAAHPFWGLVFLAAILGAVFWLTFTIGAPLQAWLNTGLLAPLAEVATAGLANAPFWLQGMLVDGLIGGVGSVLTFIPILVIFFAAFALLEDVGYMARAAYVMDNMMHLMGLHGKSFLPLFLGFGCNVPAIMGTRVIDSWPARLLTILIAPLVPCTARMAVVAFIAPAFFGSQAMLVTWGLVLASLAALVLSGILLNAVIFKGQRSAFIMEMPLYHLPDLRTIALLVWQRSIAFVKKAGTAILAMSLGVWVLSVLPGNDLNTSFLARFGQAIEPVGRLMGLDWRLTVALITSFPAKENAIATLGVLFGNAPEAGLTAALTASFSKASALSFLVVTMLFIPCMATVAVIKQETNSWRWTLLNIGLLLALSLGAGSLVYHAAVALGL